ncbi:Heat shock 70 kDa protein 1-like [Linnemannia schmuckeri]|uniref:Heat shock 70 kDa protein 1-like n=1 Tax=Linnemannia schmuckeri TaxID=64567 RepID=A0A9P5RUQ8_9FUNG|nr:Heat shock 70 kDa protein 1-like [Linnemannia schmuckeri]
MLSNAVISIPSNFSNAQRQAVVDAETAAGLHILTVILEASAAAVALVVNTITFTDPKTVLIVDFSAGTLYVTLVIIDCDITEVVTTAGNTHLGGQDFDNRLANDLVQEFQCYSRQDISSNARALARLRAVCERTKRTPSTSTEAIIEIGALSADVDFSTTVICARAEDEARFKFAKGGDERDAADFRRIIGVEGKIGEMISILVRNCMIPTKTLHTISIRKVSQTHLSVPLNEEDNTRAKNNNIIGVLEITELAPNRRGVTEIECELDIDAKGILEVHGTNSTIDSATSVTLKAQGGSTVQERD